MTVPNDTLSASGDWREYTATDMGDGLDLVALGGGRLARTIILLEDGDLLACNAHGETRHLHNLPAGFAHVGQCSRIDAGQQAAIIVYW